MLAREKGESSWLGAEALPAGLTQINETIEAWFAAGSRKQDLLLRVPSLAGFISNAACWMRDIARPR